MVGGHQGPAQTGPHHGQKGEPQLAVGAAALSACCVGAGVGGAAVQAGSLEMGGKGEGAGICDWLPRLRGPTPSLGSN